MVTVMVRSVMFTIATMMIVVTLAMVMMVVVVGDGGGIDYVSVSCIFCFDGGGLKATAVNCFCIYIYIYTGVRKKCLACCVQKRSLVG